MKRIVILGAAGQLGQALCRLDWSQGNPLNPPEIIALDLPELDISDKDSVGEFISKTRPDIVINAAAYTNVEKAQQESELCRAVNVGGPGFLARACADVGTVLVQAGTDYVFDGDKTSPYTEGDPTGGLSVYGKSKADGEAAVREVGDRHLIVRSSWLFGPGGHNFVEAILRQARQRDSIDVVCDQRGCPTYTVDYAKAIRTLLRLDQTGTFHFCNQPGCSWYEFAVEIVTRSGLTTTVGPIKTSEQTGYVARRPVYSVLDCSKYIATTGREPRRWIDSLEEYLRGRTQQREVNV